MKKLGIIITLITTMLFVGCTENYKAKVWGGTMTVNLDGGQKLVDVTWKETSLWYMTKPMTSTDIAETYTFREESSFGIIQGKVIFIESK
jgi:hypothetical protein